MFIYILSAADSSQKSNWEVETETATGLQGIIITIMMMMIIIVALKCLWQKGLPAPSWNRPVSTQAHLDLAESLT